MVKNDEQESVLGVKKWGQSTHKSRKSQSKIGIDTKLLFLCVCWSPRRRKWRPGSRKWWKILSDSYLGRRTVVLNKKPFRYRFRCPPTLFWSSFWTPYGRKWQPGTVSESNVFLHCQTKEAETHDHLWWRCLAWDPVWCHHRIAMDCWFNVGRHVGA